MDLDNLDTFRIATCDLNGQMRGKRMPQKDQRKLASGDLRMPLSVLNVDIWGADIINSPLLFASGDGDGYLLPTNRGPVPMPWLDQPSAFVGMWMFEEDGRPFEGDPRHALAQILDRYAARGWQVVAATELEFYLIDDSAESLRPPKDPASNRKIDSSAILSLQQLDAFEAFFSELYQSCAQMGINAQAASSEAGIGQFEISLQHGDALRIADDTWLFKTLLKGLARKHGYAASFMAKPYPNDAGNGLHLH
ncbi:glutamine synthetase, partial [Paracoccaceae bacterium]|nr:glutamine synthetase [Paracoccaceae bacterium]